MTEAPTQEGATLALQSMVGGKKKEKKKDISRRVKKNKNQTLKILVSLIFFPQRRWNSDSD